MANRVLRDWTTSDSVDKLSAGAEVLFTRLIMKADDYGSFHAHPKLVRAALFPLKDYNEVKITGWIDECVAAGVLFRYVADGKLLLRIVNFGQRLRNMRGAFPPPDDNSQQVAADFSERPPETKRNETEEETETETNCVSVWPSFEDFWNAYDKKEDRPKCEKKWKTINQGAREKILEHLARYIPATPDKQYRKNPFTYLNSESWNNEHITRKSETASVTMEGTINRLNSYTN